MRWLLFCGIAALLAAVPASAGWKAQNATVAVSPNPVPVGSSYQVSGCGYTPAEKLSVGTTAVDGGASQLVVADTSGCFTSSWAMPTVNQYGVPVAPGTSFEMGVWDASHGNLKFLVLMFFTVS